MLVPVPLASGSSLLGHFIEVLKSLHKCAIKESIKLTIKRDLSEFDQALVIFRYRKVITMRAEKIFTRAMKQDFSIDKMIITLTVKDISMKESGGLFKPGKTYFDLNHKALGYIKNTGKGYIGTRTLKFNGNETMRKIALKLVGHDRSLTKNEFAHKENFVHAGVRRALPFFGSSMEILRQESLNQIYDQIEIAKHELVDCLKEEFGAYFSIERVSTAFLNIEISHDKFSQEGYQMAADTTVVDAVNGWADEFITGYFDEKGQFRASGGRGSYVACILSPKNRAAIRAFVKSDYGTMEYYFYQKEDGVNGALNRSEARFDDSNLYRMFGRRSFSSKNQFAEMVSRLGEESYETLYRVLNKVHVPQAKSYDDLKPILKSIVKDWEIVLESLKKYHRVFTGGNYLTKRLNRVIAPLAKNKVIFKWVRRGEYIVDWDLVPMATKNYHKMTLMEKSYPKTKSNIKEKSKKKVKKKKSWLTAGTH